MPITAHRAIVPDITVCFQKKAILQRYILVPISLFFCVVYVCVLISL